jgi:DivIVA domain-containing protein
VAEAGFSTSRRGYQPDEVRAFLTSVAAEMSRIKEHERQLEAELRAAKAASTGRTELDEEAVTKLLGEETLRVLQTARESSSQIKIRAEENAARVLREAHDEANRVRQEAEVEAARKRHDAQSDAEAELAVAKQQGRDMVNEARNYRERVLADLERRTKLARQHIEELAHGRDRLLQVFERARLVAVDVTQGLQAVAGPDEFVNFSPTTGPVPLMVPAGRSQAATPSGDTFDEVEADHSTADAPGDGVDPVPASEGTLAEPSAEIAAEIAAEIVDEIVDEPASEIVDEIVDDAAPVPAAPVTNVVSLFRDRAEAEHDSADPDAGGELDAGDRPEPAQPEPEQVDEHARPAVDDLFARLRSEVPASDDEPAAPESTPFTRRDEALVPLITAAARKAKRALADEQNGVLDALRRQEPVTSLDALVHDADAHAAPYLAAIVSELESAAVAGAGELGAADTKTLRRSLDKAGALDAARAHVRSDLIGPLRARLERAVVDGAGDNDDITKRVRAVYREWKTQHIDDQLDDVFRFAFGGGLAVTAEPGTQMVWTLDPNHSACADCEDNSLAGSVPAGESFPTGHVAAPAHPGCRCLTLPAGE